MLTLFGPHPEQYFHVLFPACQTLYIVVLGMSRCRFFLTCKMTHMRSFCASFMYTKRGKTVLANSIAPPAAQPRVCLCSFSQHVVLLEMGHLHFFWGVAVHCHPVYLVPCA